MRVSASVCILSSFFFTISDWTVGCYDLVLYGFGLAYLVAPTTFDSVHLLTFIHELPEAVKLGGKLILAAPFSLHFFNGLRHLAWDAGKRTCFEYLVFSCVFLC